MDKKWYMIINSQQPYREEYLKAIRTWDKDGIFESMLQNEPFIAVFYQDRFLGAAIMNTPNTLANQVITINGSTIHYDEIEQILLESHQKLVKKL